MTNIDSRSYKAPAVTGRSTRPSGGGEELLAALSRRGVSDILSDAASRSHYSSDASLYRLLPQVVVRPHDADEVHAVLEASRDTGVPVVARGGGTSVAGNAIGSGIVMDFSRHMNRILTLDPEARIATVQPGLVPAVLQAAARPHGLHFGPDPSTMSRCTIGGMIANNACGSRTLKYGRTGDNVTAITVATVEGASLQLSVGADVIAANPIDGARQLEQLRQLVVGDLAVIRTQFGRFGRQASGYALEHLLPERGFDVTGLMVGSEGTLGIFTEATVRLVQAPIHCQLVVLGFADMPEAADVTADVLTHHPNACEGLDARIVDVVRQRRGEHAVPPLPGGQAWLFVELAGDSVQQVGEAVAALVATVPCQGHRIVADPVEAERLWRIRADGAGLSGRSAADQPAYAGWEDAAVPPTSLGSYLREFETLLETHDLSGFPFGHFGDGCIHVRLDFALEDGGGSVRFESFINDAADLVGKYGGSLSGEHGDGRARSSLLNRMYSPDALSLFAAVKNIFDPRGLLNPGVLVDPAPITADMRVPAASPIRAGLAFTYADDAGDFTRAVHRCTGVGSCRAQNTEGVMCPSFQATGNERESTRGRARVLQELTNGSFIGDWSSSAVHESLDLCLACKGCASDCPTGVDMATYKAEVLHQTYRHRLRPRSHYSLGWLPRWARLASVAPHVVNAVLHHPGASRVALAAAGVDHRRSLPSFAPRRFSSSYPANAATTAELPPVVLFVDTFTDYFAPAPALAAIRVLQSTGYRAIFVQRQVCCGLTWITTGQLDTAKRMLGTLVAQLHQFTDRGIPIVGLEPSCTAVLRSDAGALLGSAEAAAVASRTFTLAEFLTLQKWQPPDLNGLRVIAQPHCHHHAVLGWHTDQRLLEHSNVSVHRVAGCCGLAGNFGVETGHYEVSVAVAHQNLLPAVASDPEALVLADGFSCRTQLSDLAERDSLHLAELLAAGLDRDE